MTRSKITEILDRDGKLVLLSRVRLHDALLVCAAFTVDMDEYAYGFTLPASTVREGDGDRYASVVLVKCGDPRVDAIREAEAQFLKTSNK